MVNRTQQSTTKRLMMVLAATSTLVVLVRRAAQPADASEVRRARGYFAIVFATAFVLARGSATQAPSWVWETHRSVEKSLRKRHHPVTTAAAAAVDAAALPRFRRDAANSSCIQDAYIGNQCCAGACGTSYFACFDCLSTPEQDPYSYGGPSCFVEGSCIAQASERVCAPPARLQFDVNDGTPYAGWCLCPKGSFCHGDGCNSNTTAEAGPPPRDRWHTDTVSEGVESMSQCAYPPQDKCPPKRNGATVSDDSH